MVCGPECRRARRAKQARRRRRKNLEASRDSDRERQRDSRAARRAAAQAVAGSGPPAPDLCHEPASRAIPLEVQQQIDEIVDRIGGRFLDLSRAGLRRDLRALVRACRPSVEPRPALSAPPVTDPVISPSPRTP